VRSWEDLTVSVQQGVASYLLTAVETSSFARADFSTSPQNFIVDYDNIGTAKKLLAFIRLYKYVSK